MLAAVSPDQECAVVIAREEQAAAGSGCRQIHSGSGYLSNCLTFPACIRWQKHYVIPRSGSSEPSSPAAPMRARCQESRASPCAARFGPLKADTLRGAAAAALKRAYLKSVPKTSSSL